jgi:hypothetical protein
MTRAERAQQIWSLLALAATSRQVLTYDIVARLYRILHSPCGLPYMTPTSTTTPGFARGHEIRSYIGH